MIEAPDNLVEGILRCPGCGQDIALTPAPPSAVPPPETPFAFQAQGPIAPAPAPTDPWAAEDEAADFADISRQYFRDRKRRLWGIYGKESIGLGIAAWIMGFLPLPFLTCVAMVIALCGLASGIHAVILCGTRKKPGLGLAVAGVIVNAMFLGFLAVLAVANVVLERNRF